MTPYQVRALELQVRNMLWRAFPNAEMVPVALVAADIAELALKTAVDLDRADHGTSCSCWDCMLALQADVAKHQAQMQQGDALQAACRRAEREATT